MTARRHSGKRRDLETPLAGTSTDKRWQGSARVVAGFGFDVLGPGTLKRLLRSLLRDLSVGVAAGRCGWSRLRLRLSQWAKLVAPRVGSSTSSTRARTPSKSRARTSRTSAASSASHASINAGAPIADNTDARWGAYSLGVLRHLPPDTRAALKPGVRKLRRRRAVPRLPVLRARESAALVSMALPRIRRRPPRRLALPISSPVRGQRVIASLITTYWPLAPDSPLCSTPQTPPGRSRSLRTVLVVLRYNRRAGSVPHRPRRASPVASSRHDAPGGSARCQLLGRRLCWVACGFGAETTISAVRPSFVMVAASAVVGPALAFSASTSCGAAGCDRRLR
jgi:hypothetical protein